MNYKAITTLKKADTEGRIPEYTLDQYIRGELCRQLIDAVKSRLLIDRTDRIGEVIYSVNQETVDFTTEMILLKPLQWQQLKASLTGSIDSLPLDQQLTLRRLIDDVDTSC